ncbi:hypothetical protein GBAR_LOCUS8627, partial [Geodia barretti]
MSLSPLSSIIASYVYYSLCFHLPEVISLSSEAKYSLRNSDSLSWSPRESASSRRACATVSVVVP